MEVLSTHFLLQESEFERKVLDDVAALAIDTTTKMIAFATREAERLLGCVVEGGLIDKEFEQFIPEGDREIHGTHFDRYLESPYPRRMGEAGGLPVRDLKGKRFLADIVLRPLVITRIKRLYVILILWPLPEKK